MTPLKYFGAFLCLACTFKNRPVAHRSSPTMENPVTRSIRLMTLAAGVVSLFVYVVFHFL